MVYIAKFCSELISQTVPGFGHIVITGMKRKKLLHKNVSEGCT